MLEALVGLIVGLLVLAGILVMIGPSLRGVAGKLRTVKRPVQVPAIFQPSRQTETAPAGLNPKSQRALVGAARLANWLRSHGHAELARELRTAAGRMTANEPAGLYAMQTALRKVRSLYVEDSGSRERLTALSNELRGAVQDRFEQLELLPFKS
ncbi:MAG TPA: hypothetical protein VGG31_05340 [Candidatus Dormibacteraeota bacterium]